MTWLFHHRNHARTIHHTLPTETEPTPMSTVDKANGFLAEIQAGAEQLYARCHAMAAELAADAEQAAPVAATVISDLEPVLAAVGIPPASVGIVAAGVRALAANHAVEQLAADVPATPAPIAAAPIAHGIPA